MGMGLHTTEKLKTMKKLSQSGTIMKVRVLLGDFIINVNYELKTMVKN